MRILVAYGSERGGTEGIAQMVAEVLRLAGFAVDVRAASEVDALEGYGAVVLGGALYMGRWHRDARRFVLRHEAALRALPVWLFSSGPLDDSATRGEQLPAVPGVQKLLARIGARGHVTFGGRLLPDAKGPIAHAMARQHAGDWRNPAFIQRWAASIAVSLPRAAPQGWLGASELRTP
ncbi:MULTISPECIES: flavodoxin domain-containing protein [Myxococcaceae]|uniref:flavodoxin domain-containing protein n=1 Tax=Myxococcaceae TaxID=31 RepID=UPI001E287480|nr:MULTISPECIES: flavodoxin domain-containing protein [Myxococcaceae]